MPPKKNNKKKETKKELSEEDMRRLGMSDDDIQRVIAQRGKSSEEKKAEQEQAEERRRQVEAKQRAAKKTQEQLDELMKSEGEARVMIRDEEEEAWRATEPGLTNTKTKLLREHRAGVMQKRIEEAKRRNAEQLAAYQETLSSMGTEEREAFLNEQKKKEQEYIASLVAEEEAKQEKEARREARRQARMERLRKAAAENRPFEDDLSSDDENGNDKKKKQREAAHAAIDELNERAWRNV